MIRFYRFIACLVIGITGTVFGARAAGSRQAASAFALLFTTPDGSPCSGPCLFGIQPDVTTYDDAVELLRLHPLTRHLQLGRGPTFTGGGIQILLAEDDDGKVTQIHVQLSLPGDSGHSALNDASVGDMVTSLGYPNYIRFDMILFNSGPITYWFYNERSLIVNVEHPLVPLVANGLSTVETLRTQDRVIGLGMGSYAKQPDLDAQIVKIASWHGFALLRRYIGCAGKSIRVDCSTAN